MDSPDIERKALGIYLLQSAFSYMSPSVSSRHRSQRTTQTVFGLLDSKAHPGRWDRARQNAPYRNMGITSSKQIGGIDELMR